MSNKEDYQYTPKVEDMREYYRDTWFYAPHTNSEKEKDGEFDRFIAQYSAEVTAKAETRIIEIIESKRCSENGINHDCAGLYGWQANELIALIKGEQE